MIRGVQGLLSESTTVRIRNQRRLPHGVVLSGATGRKPMTTDIRGLIRRVLDGCADSALMQLHAHHFRRRLAKLPPTRIPGADIGDDEIQGLVNEAFAWFQRAPVFDDRTAFETAYETYPALELNFLYYWRDSATIRFLESNGDERTRTYQQLWRSCRRLLSTHFEVVGTAGGRPVFAPPDWSADHKKRRRTAAARPLVIDSTHRDADRLRTLFDTAETALTVADVTMAYWRALTAQVGLLQTQQNDALVSQPADDANHVILEGLSRRAHEAFEQLSDRERKILELRGYGGEGRLAPFKQVAEQIGQIGEERCRQIERGIFKKLRDTFDDDERDAVAEIWAQALLRGTERTANTGRL